MFNIKNIVNKIADRGRDSNPNSPGKVSEDDTSRQAAEGFLCPKCMKALSSAEDLQQHYEVSHGEESFYDQSQRNHGGFSALHEEVGERCKRQDGGRLSNSPVEAEIEAVSKVTDLVELKDKLVDALTSKSLLLVEKENLEQRAAQLARINVDLRAASDEYEANQQSLRDRLKVVEAQLAHRESIDDAAVLKQELIQVQRVMDELTREKERERDTLQTELRLLIDKYNKLEQNSPSSDLEQQLRKRDEEFGKLHEEHRALEVQANNLKEEVNLCNEKLIKSGETLKEKEAELKIAVGKQTELSDLLKCKEIELFELKNSQNQIIEELNLKVKDCNEILQNKEMELNLKINSLHKELSSIQSDKLDLQQTYDRLGKDLSIRDIKIQELNTTLTKYKENILKQENEHSELLAQIQAGEGVKTAIQQLTQDNASLQERLRDAEKRDEENVKSSDDLRNQILELETKYAEIIKELKEKNDKLKVAEQTLSDTNKSIEVLRTSINNKDVSIKELSLSLEGYKLKLANMDITTAELNQTLKNKSKELETVKSENSILDTKTRQLENYISVMKNQATELKEQLDTAKSDLYISKQTINENDNLYNQLNSKLESKELEYKSALEELQESQKTINGLKETIKLNEEYVHGLEIQRTSLETKQFELQKSLADLEDEKKGAEVRLNMELSQKNNMLQVSQNECESFKEELNRIRNEKEQLLKQNDLLEEQLKTEINGLNSEKSALLKQVDDLNTEKNKLQDTLMALQERITKLEEELQEANEVYMVSMKENTEKLKSTQTMFDDITGEKLALEAQLEASQSEQKNLLERCFASASETESMRRNVLDLRRKLDESEAALQELGRENQTLQLDLEKLTGRKWTEDSDAVTCAQCDKEFSMLVRKHHCRNCGQIFCNECSSKLAPLANNKRPVRVCDNCYSELMNV